jgi:hypothetical protein
MSPPISLYKDLTTAGLDVSATSNINSMNESAQPNLDFCVRLASHWKCNICIVVTHREAIRDLSKHKCGYVPYHNGSKSRLGTPYCCIATFVAQVEREHVDWACHGILPYEQFDSTRVPYVVIPPAISPDATTTIEQSTAGNETLLLCTIDCNPMEQSNGKLGSCIKLTYLKADEDFEESTSRLHLRFKIYAGGRQVVDFLQRLRKKRCVALGRTAWNYVDGHQMEMNLNIGWSQQLELPCPPVWIGIDLLPSSHDPRQS